MPLSFLSFHLATVANTKASAAAVGAPIGERAQAPGGALAGCIGWCRRRAASARGDAEKKEVKR